ncbi:hypothetical protein [Nodularia sphaerocarpa]|uniref:hypothetical protein n=1 Tax=Nodularia sphaerocarpa TaxID=137816 RepID=UPI00232D3CE5|nr:hypothetical protein [Nodularia sphaerocarpa]MDB9372348.1 hypothetical protein [Nodularia sphaerocarpa CS-585]MDB9377964.1 hypothetical protein [Nodularia sphaerocarpa CS-585A2]
MIKYGIKLVISLCLIGAIFLNFPSNALANMDNWKVTGSIENNTGNWVYYAYTAANAIFQTIHFSRHVDIPREDHMATNDNLYYYYGFTGTFNTQNIPENIRKALTDAWRDYFSVR